MNKLIIKQFDKFNSSLFPDKFIYQYLIYFMQDDVKLYAESVFGEDKVASVVNEQLSKNPNLIIEEITYKQHIKNNG